MNAYEAKLERRRERLLAVAEKLQREGNARYERARELASLIPFGQPILVGHYSEGRDRRFRAKIHDSFGRAFADMEAAKAAAAKAAAVGSGGISSDDPDAIAKLRAELAEVEARQDLMKRANRAILSAKGAEARAVALADQGFSAEQIGKLLTPDCFGAIGFADYKLKNNGANARRIKARIAELEARAAKAAANPEPVEQVVNGVRIVEDLEDNRVRLYFAGKPAESVRAELKSRGFRWSPSAGAWQRHLSSAAVWAAKNIAQGVA